MTRPETRSGFTLIEITIVLVVLALAAALVAPAIREPRAEAPGWASLVSDARGIAVRRAEAMVLRVDSTGVWVLAAENPATDSRVARGRIPGNAPTSLVVHISALGVCRILEGDATLREHWDALRCAPPTSVGTPVRGAGASDLRPRTPAVAGARLSDLGL